MSAAVRTVRLVTDRVIAPPFGLVRGVLRAFGLIAISIFAVVDAAIVRCVTEPTGSRLAHARAAWLHRWSRIARRVLGLQLDQRGFTPSSGIVVANHTSLLDAILVAAVRPCVFVAGAEVRRWPIVGLLARLGGTLFVDRHRRNDVARVNFMIQRAVQRRLLVVIFPETQCESVVRLLAIFAQHLGLVAKQLAIRATNSGPPAVAKARQFMRGHQDEDLALGDVARALNMSTFYFCKTFKKRRASPSPTTSAVRHAPCPMLVVRETAREFA